MPCVLELATATRYSRASSCCGNLLKNRLRTPFRMLCKCLKPESKHGSTPGKRVSGELDRRFKSSPLRQRHESQKTAGRITRPAVSIFNNQSNYSSRSAMTVAVPVTTRRLLACPVPSRLISSTDQGLMGSMGIGFRSGGAMPKTRSGRCKAGSLLGQYKEGLWRK